MNTFRKWLVSGILVVLPLIISLAFIVWFFNFTTSWLEGDVSFWKRLGTFFCMLIGLMLIGALAGNFVGSKLIGLFNAILDRVPLFNRVYGSVRRIANAFAGNQSMFSKVVYVEYPVAGTYAVAFETANAPAELDAHDGTQRISVFMPTTPNPTSGVMLCVPREKVIYSDMNVSDAIQMIVSSGAVPPTPPAEPPPAPPLEA
jgi:uncharacterized membrane protein